VRGSQTFLIRPRRVCCACGASSAPLRPAPGEPNILAVSLTVYRKGAGKATLKGAGKVNICEACLSRALAPSTFGMGREAKHLLLAMRERLSGCYSTLLDEDKQPEQGFVPGGELFA
jgi:hypothetical protein